MVGISSMVGTVWVVGGCSSVGVVGVVLLVTSVQYCLVLIVLFTWMKTTKQICWTVWCCFGNIVVQSVGVVCNAQVANGPVVFTT